MTIDCADPDRLARFWAEALHYRLEEPPEGFATWADYWRSKGVPEEEVGEGIGYDSVVDPGAVGPRIWFQQVPEPKVVKNRVHLDLDVTGGRRAPVAERRAVIDAEVERLVKLGATVVRVQGSDVGGSDYYAATMRDPEGNEFCVS
ncbi:VOC family protein [Thermoactinospora rubra]|uniref:VOC family protein n=1 Tax=Thermoactinospora rubra TaxID=1088767 RepID=UPI001F0A3DD0|nr:VOC family protein [Thermoactinospora rubra]